MDPSKCTKETPRPASGVSFPILIALAILAMAGSAISTFAQVEGHPNTIQGIVGFTNPPGPVRTLLEGGGDGLYFVATGATSFATPTHPDVFSSVSYTLPVDTPTSTSYAIHVEGSTDPSDGIVYFVEQIAFLEADGREVYDFRSKVSEGVIEAAHPPGYPPVTLDFRECAGMVLVKFVEVVSLPGGGTMRIPRAIQGGVMYASIDDDGDGIPETSQAGATSISSGVTEELLAIRGPDTPGDPPKTAHIVVTVQTGTDPYHDTIRSECDLFPINVFCNEFTDVECVVPRIQPPPSCQPGDPGCSCADPQDPSTCQCDPTVPECGAGGQCVPSGPDLGTICGEVEMVGEIEHRISDFTFLEGFGGPFGNYRFDSINATPSSGAFTLENLVPGGYLFTGLMSFRTGRDFEFFQIPGWQSNLNPRVNVAAGGVTDTGNRYVMQPGDRYGDILFVGPRPDPVAGACLEDIRRDSDVDPTNYVSTGYVRSVVHAYGLDEVAPGGTLAVAGGVGAVQFHGEYAASPSESRFESTSTGTHDYGLVLAGLAGEPSFWSQPFLSLLIDGRATPSVLNPFRLTGLEIASQAPEDQRQLVVPGQAERFDFHYCFGVAIVEIGISSGQFYQPDVTGTGRFDTSIDGTDFEGNLANYSVSVGLSAGVPESAQTAAAQGQVVLCLPEGRYDLQTRIKIGSSTTALPPIHQVYVPCRGTVILEPCLVPSLDVAACSDEQTITVTGSIDSCHGNVASVSYSVNGGPTTACCTNCGGDPSFSCSIPLADCQNQIVVTATNDAGDTASVTTYTNHDTVPPVIQQACSNQRYVAGPNGTVPASQVSLPSQATDACDGPRIVSCNNPDPFPIGNTLVTCTSETDSCGRLASCQFTVTVVSCDPAACDDHITCTLDFCNEQTGLCDHTPNNAACDDGNPCSDDSCNPATGCLFTPDDTNLCMDDNACTRDLCLSGQCVSTGITCNDNNPCTNDSCNPTTGCAFVASPPGTPCGDPSNTACDNPDTCDGHGMCQPNNELNGTPCDDNNQCNGHEVCLGAVCQPGTPLNCNDGCECTTDSCAPATGCVHTQPIPGFCGDVCTTLCGTSSQVPGGTVSIAVDPNGDVTIVFTESLGINDNSYGTNIVNWPRNHNFSDLVGSDKAQFVFRNGSGNVVFDIFVDYITAKSGTPSGYASLGVTGGDGAVNLGQAAWLLAWQTSEAANLNTTGYCLAGNCTVSGVNLLVNSPTTNPPNTSYNLPPAFNQWFFPIQYMVKVSHLAFGSAGFGSVSIPFLHNSPPKAGCNATDIVECAAGPCPCPGGCDDGNTCTTDACVGGQCVHTPDACDDHNPCTDDTCNPTSGCSSTLNNANTCSDGNQCTTDACVNGQCVGSPINCADGNSCTADSCDPTRGCLHTGGAVTASISSSFNGTAIPAGRYIWFDSIVKVSGVGGTATTIRINNSTIRFTVNATPYILAVPDGVITFDPAATCATTSFNAGLNRWETRVPLSGSDEVFLSGLGYLVPANFPGGIKPVTWEGDLSSDKTGVTLEWKWGAAVYTTDMTNYNALGVKPTHANACLYINSDHAGTPENKKSFVVGGARGSGGSNYTGSWSGKKAVQPGLCTAGFTLEPAAVEGLWFTNPTTFVWQATADALVYDVVRGDLSQLHANGSVGDAWCTYDDLPVVGYSDDEIPTPGNGFYYLVRGDAPLPTTAGTYDNTGAPPIGAEGRDYLIGTAGGLNCTHRP